MKDKIELHLKEVKEEYDSELLNGTKENATDRAKILHGEIQALKWVLNLYDNVQSE